MTRYDKSLRKRPLLTKCVSSGIIMGACEFNSQALFIMGKGELELKPVVKGESGFMSSEVLREGYQVGRVNIGHCAAFGCLSGACYLAPFMHSFYLVSSSWWIPKRIILNSLVIDPINYAMAMIINAIAHGEGLQKGISTVQEKIYDTIITGFAVWPMAQVRTCELKVLSWETNNINITSMMRSARYRP